MILHLLMVHVHVRGPQASDLTKVMTGLLTLLRHEKAMTPLAYCLTCNPGSNKMRKHLQKGQMRLRM